LASGDQRLTRCTKLAVPYVEFISLDEAWAHTLKCAQKSIALLKDLGESFDRFAKVRGYVSKKIGDERASMIGSLTHDIDTLGGEHCKWKNLSYRGP